MSNNLAAFDSMDLGPGHAKMHVTAFVAVGEGVDRMGVQFTLDGGRSYCALNGAQALKLLALLAMRVNCEMGYSATDDDLEWEVPVRGY